MTVLAEVERAARTVCADGTDPAAVAAVLAWTCGPRRRSDALRRRLRMEAADASGGEEPTVARPSERLSALARSDGRPGAPVLDVALHVLRQWTALGVRVALVGDPTYPDDLAEGWPDVDAPPLLAWRGTPPGHAGPGVALVGARNATAYGTAVAELLATAVARAGGRVVSGGAIGIDAAAHDAALGLPGGTTVVLGCGHAVRYPVPHARQGGLFDRVLEDGGTLVSELLPEVGAHPGVIRARNRIVAGLARVTVVVEGGSRSGALLTASAAADRGRDVLAVPGDLLAPGSAAPLKLLSEGARACTGPRDVLALLPDLPVSLTAGRGLPAAGGVMTVPADLGMLPAPVREALERAGPRGMALEDLALVHDGPAGALLAALTRARLAGALDDVPGGVRLRPTRPSVR